MSIKGQVIPEIQGVKDPKVAEILTAMKDAIERMSGSAPTKKAIVPLGAGAVLAGVINKLNEVIAQLQGR